MVKAMLKKGVAMGLKPSLILDALRGAEAPLFYVTAHISELFRSLLTLRLTIRAGGPRQ
jgi:hypothetical protein